MSEENPTYLIPIEKIKNDFIARAAVSDFHPVKEKLLKYDGEEVLVVLDDDFVYGQNFYTFCTEEHKQKFLARLVKDLAAVEEAKGVDEEDEWEEEVRVRREGPWEHLGSDEEIKDEIVVPTRSRIKMIVKRRRLYFGKPTSFSDSKHSEEDMPPEEKSRVDITSYRDEEPNELFRVEVDASCA